MPAATVKPTDRATREDQRYWEDEANAFAFKPGNPNAPQNSVDYKTWGIPKTHLPPPDAFAYVLAHYREQEQGLRIHDKNHRDYTEIHPMYKWSFLSACMAHFLWFRTPAGAAWIMRLCGIEEVAPFVEGYAYFWSDPKTGNTALLEPPTYQTDQRTGRAKLISGVELRIFREWERVLDPPCSQTNTRPIDEMKRVLLAYRSPLVVTEAHLPSDQVFMYVSEILRDWFLEAQPNREWPYRKPDRIVGSQWIRQLERGPNTKFYEALEKVALYKGRAYRLKDKTGGVYWCGGKEIRIVPRQDLYLEHNLKSEAEVDIEFRCKSCQKRRSCVPHTGDHKMCCHCYSVAMDSSDRPTLDKCTMDRECKRCPDVIANPTDLITLKNRLNRPARSPVPR